MYFELARTSFGREPEFQRFVPPEKGSPVEQGYILLFEVYLQAEITFGDYKFLPWLDSQTIQTISLKDQLGWAPGLVGNLRHRVSSGNHVLSFIRTRFRREEFLHIQTAEQLFGIIIFLRIRKILNERQQDFLTPFSASILNLTVRLFEHRNALIGRRGDDWLVRTRSRPVGLFKKQTIRKISATAKNADRQTDNDQHLHQIIHEADCRRLTCKKMS
jgi:hypothetical protein